LEPSPPLDLSQLLIAPPALESGGVVQDYAEFSGLPLADIIQNIKEFQSLNAAEFYASSSAEAFYRDSKNYIYDLLATNWDITATAQKLNTFIPNLFQILRDYPGKTLLEFGGGTGVFTEITKRFTDKDITYVDIKGHISDFATWRFQKHHLDINVLIVPQDDFSLPQQYDIIFTDAVLEHVPPERQSTYICKLAEYTAPNGLLFTLIDLTGNEPMMPMHFDVDIQTLHQALLGMGMKNLAGLNQFVAVWQKPALS
jgi:protein-L-isoaspartate O-methyltransferase